MELKNIFKMEMFKNRNDKPYLLVIAILTVMAATATFWGIAKIESGSVDFNGSFFLMILLIVFTLLGLGIFSFLYPFHLLNTDYRNKVMSLIFASGVSREKYYFVKISATILTCFIAALVILFIPIVTFLVIYPEFFVEMMQNLFANFSFIHILPFLLSAIFGLLASIVTLTTAVIITKGQIAGILLYFAFLFIVSSISSAIFPMTNLFANEDFFLYFNLSALFSIIQIIVFVFIGLQVLKRQDL